MTLPLVIEPEQLHACRHSELIIIDLSSEQTYLRAHLPGAVHLNPARLLRGEGKIPNLLPNALQLTQLWRELGITTRSHVVCYDDQNGAWAGRLIWSLHCCNLLNTSFLNGQLAGWQEKKLPTAAGPVALPAPSDISIELDNSRIASRRYLLERLPERSIALWDARSLAEYTGAQCIDASKAGHIPGACWLEWTDTLTSLKPPRLASPERLLETIQQAGIDTHLPVVTYCQTHRRSSLTYIAALHAGIEQIKCYDGSWFEWGNAHDTPVATQQDQESP